MEFFQNFSLLENCTMNNERFEDILGFTRQTETLITGLGGTPGLIEEFRKRNISTDELTDLTEYDLIALGM